MADRDTTSGATSPKPTGPDFLTEYAGHIGKLFDNSLLPLTNTSGADIITASVDPKLPSGGLVAGMKFSITWAADNTGAATLNIDGAGAVDIVGKSSEALVAGQLAEDARDVIEYDGTNFILLTGGSDISTSISGQTAYETSTTWDNNLPVDAIVMVECWGAGGGGFSTQSGGGGGAYVSRLFRAGDLPASVAITVPSGAAAGADGGDCTFGSFLTAYGGGGTNSSGERGGGGGEIEAGDIDQAGRIGGGDPDGGDAKTIWGGGGGGSNAVGGGNAVYGGGGGAGVGQSPGVSVFGGNGGAINVAGSAPGGGGGSNAAGARGECRVTVF